MSEELVQLGVRSEELGGSEGQENLPVASFHRGTGRQALSVANGVSEDSSAAQILTVANQLIGEIARLNARLSALEDESKVTILHQDALRLSSMIKARARAVADRYQLGPAGERRIRAAIKRDVLSQYGIRDLHDLPARRLTAARMLIEGWSSWQAVREASMIQGGVRREEVGVS